MLLVGRKERCTEKVGLKSIESVFVHTMKPKTTETEIAKLDTGIVHHEFSPTNGQRVIGQGHRVTQCKKAIEWPA